MRTTGKAEAGIAAAIVGNIVVNVALNLQRYTRRRLVNAALHGWQPFNIRDQTWTLGLVLMIAGEASNLVAYGLAPASVVSPLGVFVVISNCVIPPLLFDEMPHLHTIVGTMLALPGIFLLILTAPGPIGGSAPITDESVRFIAGSLVLAMVLATVRVATRRRDCWRWLLANVSLSALMGAFCVLALKRLTVSIASGHEDPGLGGNAVYMAVFIVAGWLQVSLLMDVLRTYELWHVVPQHFAFFTAYVAIGSGVLCGEFSATGLAQRLEFVASLILVVVGVWLASKPHQSQSHRRRSTNAHISMPRARRARILKRYQRSKRSHRDTDAPDNLEPPSAPELTSSYRDDEEEIETSNSLLLPKSTPSSLKGQSAPIDIPRS